MDIKDYIFVDGKIVQQRTIPRIIKSRFPEVYEKLDLNRYYESLYCFIYDIEEPVCKECQSPVKFHNFNKGFRQFCSNRCVGKYQKNNKEFSDKISSAKKEKYDKNYYIEKYGNVHNKDGEYFILDDNTKIHKEKYKRLNDFTIIDSYESFMKNFNDIKYKISKQWLSEYMPSVKKLIENYSKDTTDFNTLRYMFIHNIINIPKCHCGNPTKLLGSYSGFSMTCESYACRRSSSKFERDVFKFISNIYKDEIDTNYRIDNKEIDIFIPHLNLGIECNGLYWHSEVHKDKNYHKTKTDMFKSHGIKVIHIWEDDWDKKTDLIKSMIMNHLGLSQRIFARKCKIRLVDKKISISFLKDNHLQGNCVDTTRIGLYYQDELVSLMTFGKRSILKNIEHELLRFCTKKGFIVVGGASKLLKYFIKEYQIEKLLSFANSDISNGNLYEKLGFEKLGYTAPGYWWCDGKTKYHRSNFMKHKLVKQGFDKDLTEVEIMHKRGFYRIYDSGNIKYKL